MILSPGRTLHLTSSLCEIGHGALASGRMPRKDELCHSGQQLSRPLVYAWLRDNGCFASVVLSVPLENGKDGSDHSCVRSDVKSQLCDLWELTFS